MAFTPLALGTNADPLSTLTSTDPANLLQCGVLDLGKLNAFLKLIADRVDAIDAADNAILGASYDAVSNELTFAMSDGAPVIIDMSDLVADAIADSLITGSAYNATTNVLTFTMGGGDTVDIDMSGVISDAISSAVMPTGSIVMWSGAISTIPSGWALCDGAGSTPDLRGMFVIGAGGAYPVGASGGAATHDHGGKTGETVLTEAMTPPHQHHVVGPAGVSNDALTGTNSVSQERTTGGDTEYILNGNPAGAVNGVSSEPVGDGSANEGHDHVITSGSNLPPYFALCYIIKL